VEIVATSIGNDYTAAQSRKVQIHLIQTGVITPPTATPLPSFVIAPSAPVANQVVLFDASASCAGQPDAGGECPPLAGTIVRYSWNFGDGATATGRTASHAFARQQTYQVTLTVTNDLGISASKAQTVAVAEGAAPAPAFISSPTDPVPGQTVYFDATMSTAGAEHRIVRFVWNWGDGSDATDSSVPTASHPFAAGTWVVTLTVADETGQTATTTRTVVVKVPES
jgi:PKD repeat protein